MFDTSDLEDVIFDPKHTFLKIQHKEFQTDFLPVTEGVGTYRECKARAEKVEIDDVTIHVISYDDLIANKRAINRQMDQKNPASLPL